MVQITDQQISELREHPHRTQLFLGIYEPPVVVSLQINMSTITKGEREITVAVLGGEIDSIERGMTCYISEVEPSGKEIGRIRAISGTGTTLTLAENDFDWEDGWYLTVTNFYEPWAVFPRITLDATGLIPTFFKDYDIEYADQHLNWRPVVNMGGNYAGFLETGALGVWYTSSGTYVPEGAISSYLWDFEGGIPTGSTSADPGYIQYDTPGFYTTKLTVTSALGKTFTGTRHILIYDKADEGGSRPIANWGIKNMQGARSQGGYTATLWIREKADLDKIVEGALIVIFSKDWEGGEERKLGGNSENRTSIFFVGYITSGAVFKRYGDNRYEFKIESITGRMKQLATYSGTLESKKNPSTWNEAKDMTADLAVIALLKSQTTILNIADFEPTGDDKLVQYADFERGDMFNTVNSFYELSMIARIVSDRQGKIWAEEDLSIIPTGSRDQAIVLEMNNQDWMGELKIQERQANVLAYAELGGIAYSGSETGTWSAHLSSAPGDVAGYEGSVGRSQGLILSGQPQLNELVALVYARANATFPKVDVQMSGDYRIIDIAPQERVTMTLAANDTYRRLIWNGKYFVPEEIAYQYRPQDQHLGMVTTLTEETWGIGVLVGEEIEIPEDPPVSVPELSQWDWDWPTIPFLPPVPLIDDVPTSEPPPLTEQYVIGFWNDGTDNYFAWTRNFQDESPTWNAINTTGAMPLLRGVRVNPFNPNQVIGWSTTANNDLWITNNLLAEGSGTSWSQLLTNAEIDDIVNIAFAGGPSSIEDVQWSPVDSSRILVYVACSGPGTNRGQGLLSTDGGASWGGTDEAVIITTGTGKPGNEPISDSPCILRFAENGSRVYALISASGDQAYVAYSDDGGETWQYANDGDGFGSNTGGFRDVIILDSGGAADQVLATKWRRAATDNTVVFSTDKFHDDNTIDTPSSFGGFIWANMDAANADPALTRAFQRVGSVIYGMFQQNNTGNPETLYTVSPDNGFSWQILKVFIDEADWDGEVRGFNANRGNALRHYAYRPYSDGKWRPIGSADGGLNWIDKVGNLTSIWVANSRSQLISPITVIYG